ncbi:hypothetical protein [Pseudomonas sp. NPDC007930]|uniref:hypothetical protein n=1 Tax=Pseudomonas sp. NPDC007930 TaxID=3364417 RepID=UPI0036EC88B1
MNIQIVETQGQRWQVRLGQHAVTFRSEQEAKGFVLTLQKRLRAPHEWPPVERLAS